MPHSEVDVFCEVYQDILGVGKISSPRGQKIMELEDYQFTLQPYDRFTSFRCRNLSMDYIKAELTWYLRADPYDSMITEHAQIWKDIRQDDGRFFSNYGQYIFGYQNGAQFVIDELRADIDSRRAVIPLLNASHLFHSNKDVVCTYSISFRVRDNKLNMSVNMRSNDAIWGMTNDVACFSFIHEIVHSMLTEYMPIVKLGTYTHKVDSLHVYERHFNLLKNLANNGPDEYYKIEVPRVEGITEVYELLDFLQNGACFKSHRPFTDWLLNS
jgi:thymidylate synthase